MTVRNRYRLQIEELEQRAVPATLLHGTHSIATHLTASFVPPASFNGTFAGSIIAGTVSGNGMITSLPGADPTTAAGTLKIHTKQGNIFTQDTLSVPSPGGQLGFSGTFTGTVHIIGGTGRFKGVTGDLVLTNGQYTVNPILGTGTASADATGTITGGSAHGHHHHP
jgi:hypothetical protein